MTTHLPLAADGFARAGSQRQLQRLVELSPEVLSAAVRAAFADMGDGDAIEWVSPLRSDGFREYRDAAFLERVGYGEYAPSLAGFWPRGGPVWDGLGVVRFAAGGLDGVVLVEAKSHVAEMHGGGCRAVPDSRRMIRAALAWTKLRLGADPAADWTGPLYQSANRLAHLCFLREACGIPTWLVSLCFVDDPRSPTDEAAWREALARARCGLGLSGAGAPFHADILLPATA